MIALEGLGFPTIGKTSKVKKGSFISWIPGMRTDKWDWHLIVWHGSNIRNYFKQGGDPKKAIIHFLAYDQGTIEPLWGSDTFRDRLKMLKDWGIDKVVAPDFSSWADFPVVLQLHNYYRSARVTQDFILAGLDVIPNICWSHEACDNVSIGMWKGARPFALIDANHWGQRKNDKLMFKRGLQRLVEAYPKTRFIIYTGNKYISLVAKNYVKNGFIVPCRAVSVRWSSKNAKNTSNEQA